MNILTQASFTKNDYHILSEETLYQGFLTVKRLNISHRAYHQQADIHIQRETIHRPHASGALICNHQQQKFVLIEQFRVGAINDEHSPWQLEIVAGVLDGDETPETCIRRECIEEAGCEVQQLQHLFTFYPSAGACSEIFDLYIAQCHIPASSEQGQVHGMTNEGENILVHIFDYQHVDELLYSGRLRNAPVIMALQWLSQYIKTTTT